MDNTRDARLNKPDARLNTICKHWSQMQLTQVEAAKQMGISQPCFNQYLKGKIPLNTDTIIKFAILFDIAPSEIDPHLNLGAKNETIRSRESHP